MFLHDAIKLVLRENGRGMTYEELEEVINQRKLYVMKDGRPVSKKQIRTRVNKKTGKDYSQDFTISDNIVNLK